MNGMKEVHIVTSIAINPKDPTILYGGTTGGIYRSDDGAMSWKRINNGLIPESELMASHGAGRQCDRNRSDESRHRLCGNDERTVSHHE